MEKYPGEFYNFLHYHINKHENLGICQGEVKVQSGGPGMTEYLLIKGDVILLPAVVSPQKGNGSGNFTCMGRCPGARSQDMNEGRKDES